MLQIIRRTTQLAIIFLIVAITILSHYGILATERRQRDFNHVLDETVTPLLHPLYKAMDKIISPPHNPKELVESLDLFKGGVWSINIFGINLTDPLAALGAVIASHNIHIPLIATLALPLLFTLIFGRAFCGWICPMNTLLEINDRIKRFISWLGVPVFNKNLNSSYKYIILLSGLLLSISGFSIFPYILPYAIISREIYYGVFYSTVSAGIVIIFLILLFEILISRRAWCRYLCPGGAFFSLIGSMRLVRIRRDSSRCMADCSICDDACKQGLEPRIDKIGMECDNCGLCVSKCPTGALTYKFQISNFKFQIIGIFFLIFNLQSSIFNLQSFAAHDNLINPHNVSGEFPQTPSEDYIKEVDGYILNFSAFQFAERDSIRIKAVVTVKDKNGMPYHGPLTIKFIKNPLFGKSKEEIVRTFDSPVEHSYKHFDNIPYEAKFKVIVQFNPDGRKEVITDFPFTVGTPKQGRLTVIIISAIAVLSFGIVFYIKKKRGVQLTERESRFAG